MRSLKEFFGGKVENQRVSQTISMPLNREVVEWAASGMSFQASWLCAKCGNALKIRARDDRASGPSNYEAFPVGHKRAGQATLPTLSLTWNGLAEERGWKTDPVECPACIKGMTLREYKDYRRLRGA